MEQLLDEIFARNAAMQADMEANFGPDPESEQQIRKGEAPAQVLMIDGKTRRPVSPQMRDFYDYAISWTNAFFGLDVVDPNTLSEIYADPQTAQALTLNAEYMKPLPPSEPDDWARTAVFARDPQGMELMLLWWQNPDDVEPAVVPIVDGTVEVFGDMMEMARYFAHGATPEAGQRLNDWFYAQRDT